MEKIFSPGLYVEKWIKSLSDSKLLPDEASPETANSLFYHTASLMDSEATSQRLLVSQKYPREQYLRSGCEQVWVLVMCIDAPPVPVCEVGSPSRNSPFPHARDGQLEPPMTFPP